MKLISQINLHSNFEWLGYTISNKLSVTSDIFWIQTDCLRITGVFIYIKLFFSISPALLICIGKYNHNWKDKDPITVWYKALKKGAFLPSAAFSRTIKKENTENFQ